MNLPFLLAIQFDQTIRLGDIVTMSGIITAFLAAAWRFMDRLKSLERTLNSHSDILTGHSSRMQEYERGMRDIIGDVQRVIGRLDLISERRRSPRSS